LVRANRLLVLFAPHVVVVLARLIVIPHFCAVGAGAVDRVASRTGALLAPHRDAMCIPVAAASCLLGVIIVRY